MNIQDFKKTLSTLEQLTFVLPSGSHVAPHFHLTEVGMISKFMLIVEELFEKKITLISNFGAQMI